jgi:glycolate oxidase iron-sulfur subunit
MSTEQGPTTEWNSLCVHCGLCLDTCPTYRLTGLEAESPRGRLYLMNAVLNGSAPLDRAAIAHLDSCLGCLACESACPSGVRYGSQIEAFRPRIARYDPRFLPRLRARLVRASSNPKALRFIRGLAAILDRFGLETLRRSIGGIGLIPRTGREPGAALLPSPRKPRLRVALLVGCVANQLRPSITNSAVNVLRRNGVEVVLLPEDTCCGALHFHSGDSKAAARSASATCVAVARVSVDRVITTAAGCGAILRRYEELLGHDPTPPDTAAWITRNSRDVCEVLAEIGFRSPHFEQAKAGTIAYHDACHLLHGCGVDRAPRAVLTAAGVRWLDLGENSLCCGSAGTYNLTHPDAALDLGQRKVELLLRKGASGVAVGNIGCIMQLERALAQAGRKDIAVWHPVELLEAAYRAEARD